MKIYIEVLILLALAGCVSDGSSIDLIYPKYERFVTDCYEDHGRVRINRPWTTRRIANAPLTPWEMQDAECVYVTQQGAYHIRMQDL